MANGVHSPADDAPPVSKPPCPEGPEESARALAASELRYRRLFEAAKDGILILDATTGMIVDVNPFLTDMLGFSRAEFLGKYVWELGFFKNVVANAEKFVELQQREYVRYENLPLETADGQIREVEFVSNVYLADGKRVIQCNIRDITERKRTEESLWQSREILRVVLDNIPARVFWKDINLNYLGCNLAFARDAGFENFEAVVGKDDFAMQWREQAECYRTDDRAVIHEGIPRLLFEEVQTTPTGGTIHLLTSKVPLRSADGATIGVLGTYMDISDRRRLEAERESLQSQVRQAQKLESLGTLAGGVAHEISNPIMGIMNYAQLMLDKLGPDHALAEYAREIGHETERVATIVRNLLAFARQENQSHSPARMCDIVEGTLSLVRTVLRHDQIVLAVDVPQTLPTIACRSQQIQQVMMNLITNARDALNQKYPGNHDNKKISVSSSVFDQDGRRWVRTTVTDSGPGIPDQVRERMYEPFYTTKPRDRGTGLGLSISHGIVKDHGGHITVETELGQWTRFHVDLPTVTTPITG